MWAAALAAALLPLTVIELVRAARLPADVAWLASCIVLFTVLHAAVVVRRSLPRTALVVASAAMLGLVVASLPGTPFVAMLQPSSAVFVVFVYTAAAGDDRWADAGALVIGLVGAALMTVVAMAHGFAPEPDPGAGPIIALAGFLVASIGASWALGRYRRESRRTRAAQQVGLEQAAQLRLQAERTCRGRRTPSHRARTARRDLALAGRDGRPGRGVARARRSRRRAGAHGGRARRHDRPRGDDRHARAARRLRRPARRWCRGRGRGRRTRAGPRPRAVATARRRSDGHRSARLARRGRGAAVCESRRRDSRPTAWCRSR